MKQQSKSLSERVFDGCNIMLMVIVLFLTLYPFWYVIVVSFSSISHVIGSGFLLWPDGIHLDAYEQVFRNSLIPNAYLNTIFIVGAGTFLAMVLTTLGAYVLSIRSLPGRATLTLFIAITMLFSGGMIPFYLVVNQVGMINTLWALIVPGCVSSYNLILMRNFFQNVPESIYEASAIDGISRTGYLLHILLPLSASALATITLFYAVSYWNDYFSSILFIRERSLWPMQRILREALLTMEFNSLMYDDAQQKLPPETVKNAMVVITVIPIICVYPFIQKYFVKGIMVGSVKG